MTLMERLDAHLGECASGIEVGHAGAHLGIENAMKEPYPTIEQVRECLKELVERNPLEAELRMSALEECPW